MQTSTLKRPEVTYVDGPVVSCDGGCGPLGHPLVYLRVGHEGYVDCLYCGRRFIPSNSCADDRSENAAS